MADITAIILTRNEENHLKACIESIKPIVKRIVVVDSFSEDSTVDLGRELGAEVYQHEFYNHSRQYKYAVETADIKTKWILKIDADERLTKESADELEKLCNENENTDVTGIVLRFCQVFMGKALKHGEYYPWRKLSVYKTGFADVEDKNLDEHIMVTSGRVIKASKDSIHDFYKGLDFFTAKSNWYSAREAMDYFAGHENADAVNSTNWAKMHIYYKMPMLVRAWMYYVYSYYFKLGFLDGKEGKIYAFLHAYWYRFLVDAKIYEHLKMGTEFKPTGALEFKS